MKSHLVDIEGEVAQTRTLAIAIKTGAMEEAPGGGERPKWFWLPLSAVEVFPADATVGQKVTVTMPESLAIDKGLV